MLLYTSICLWDKMFFFLFQHVELLSWKRCCNQLLGFVGFSRSSVASLFFPFFFFTATPKACAWNNSQNTNKWTSSSSYQKYPVCDVQISRGTFYFLLILLEIFRNIFLYFLHLQRLLVVGFSIAVLLEQEWKDILFKLHPCPLLPPTGVLPLQPFGEIWIVQV